jgi:hypothetical protein
MLVVDQVNDMEAMLRFLTLMHKSVIAQVAEEPVKN